MKIIVGLGNPGPRYRYTRHNLGFRVVDLIAKTFKVEFDLQKYQGVIAEVRRGDARLMLLKPLTMMNLSGESVAAAIRYTNCPLSDILVVYDDLDLPLGEIRLRASGTAGTHNGMRSVLERAGTPDLPRLRMGIGNDPGRRDVADYVLAPFEPNEQGVADAMVERASEAATVWATDGVRAAMNRFNGRVEARADE